MWLRRWIGGFGNNEINLQLARCGAAGARTFPRRSGKRGSSACRESLCRARTAFAGEWNYSSSGHASFGGDIAGTGELVWERIGVLPLKTETDRQRVCATDLFRVRS
jgi:hypothetical protein